MAPERWRKVEELYHLALEQDAELRAAFVAEASRGDEELRQELESLLAAAEGDDGYLETPALQVAAKTRDWDDAHLAGTMVSHYRLVENLGTRDGADVYRAEDMRLGRPVALKFVHRLAGDSQALERFQREARSASRLNHPNICTVYEIDEWEGVPFIAMEFLEGLTLDRWLQRKSLTIDEFLDVAMQIADGLDAAHTQGLVHRDLKTVSIFITTRGQAKILDFGLSPGRAAEQDSDAWDDVFQFGGVLREMAQSTSNLHPLPSKLEDVIAKALESDRDVRHQHVADLRADLKRSRREIDSHKLTRTLSEPPVQPARLGRYQITGELGAGGMGTAYQGVDPMIGRTVAIKTILQERLGSPREAAQLRERLKREARAAGNLTHPNIVTVFDAGEEAGVTYVVMELIRGPTLDAILPAAGTPLGTERALSILAEAAAALDFAHRHDVVHRDVKPSNIMIQEDGTVKLTDFGIARRVTATTVTRPGGLIGSPHFMSPEQLNGREATARSDQYALAVIGWILLTGEKPFDDEQLMPLITRILSQDPLENSRLSAAADRVLRRALAKDAAARFASCSAFVAALRDVSLRKAPQTPVEKSAAIIPQPIQTAPEVSARPPCQTDRFVLQLYGDALSGEMVWTGSLPRGGRLSIENLRGSTGRLQGDVLPRDAPVRVSVSPEIIRLVTAPMAANCWAPRLVLQNTAETATEIRIRWEVFQP